MSVSAVGLVVPDVREAAAVLAATFGWRVTEVFDEFAEVRTGSPLVGPSGSAPVPFAPVAGVTLPESVDDVDAAAQRAREAGAQIVHGPVHRDVGLRSAIVPGRAGLPPDGQTRAARTWAPMLRPVSSESS